MKKRCFAGCLLAAFAMASMAAQGQEGGDPFEELEGMGEQVVSPEPLAQEPEEVFTEEPEPATDDDMTVDLSDTPRTFELDMTNIEASVSELQRLLNLPATGQLREYQEDPANPRSIFTSESDIQRIFGDRPRFIYFPEGVDPMIIPWVRERIASEEMWQEAGIARANGDFDRAIGLLRELRERFPGTEAGGRAPAEINRVLREREEANRPVVADQPDLPTAPVEADPVLPDWVKNNTSGIMLGDTPRVIVGNDFLTEGDPVPRYASVHVKTIRDSEVVYVYQDREFTVEVVGTF